MNACKVHRVATGSPHNFSTFFKESVLLSSRENPELMVPSEQAACRSGGDPPWGKAGALRPVLECCCHSKSPVWTARLCVKI